MTITATVGPAGPPAPTGTVGFTSNGVAISGCTAVPLSSSRTAVCTTSTLAVGTDAIVATYSGDSNYSGSSGTLSQLVNPIPSPLQFVAVTPCRVVDTRNPNGTVRRAAHHRTFLPQLSARAEWQPCDIPATAVAYSLNVTVVPRTFAGLSDHLAGRRRPAGGLHPELAGWPHQGQRRHRSGGTPMERSACMSPTRPTSSSTSTATSRQHPVQRWRSIR